jgi:hypothetical protein
MLSKGEGVISNLETLIAPAFTPGYARREEVQEGPFTVLLAALASTLAATEYRPH